MEKEKAERSKRVGQPHGRKKVRIKMSEAKLCDRCGKFYVEKRTLDIPAGLKTYDVSGNILKRYDLCSDCVEKLERFMLNTETESKNRKERRNDKC